MAKKITGLTTTTPDKLLLGAGAFYKNFDVTTDTPATASAKLLGATQGGGTFAAVPTVRQIPVDGSNTNVKELATIDDWVVTLVANVKEITAENLALALGAAVTTTETTPAGYKKVTGKADFVEADYSNIVWAGTLSGSDKPVYIELTNALSLNGLNLTMADKSESVVAITLTGHYSLDDLETPPFAIYYPTA